VSTPVVAPDFAALPPGYEPMWREEGFVALTGPLYVRKPKNGHTLAWAFRAGPQHLNPGGVVHGGMLVTFADHALGAMVFFAAGKKPCSTIDLACSFVAPGRPGDWIECTSEVVRSTASLIFMHGRVFVGARTLLDVKGIWKIQERWLGAETSRPRT
jgi:uncharacterized protein (TIGR00369 family)